VPDDRTKPASALLAGRTLAKEHIGGGKTLLRKRASNLYNVRNVFQAPDCGEHLVRGLGRIARQKWAPDGAGVMSRNRHEQRLSKQLADATVDEAELAARGVCLWRLRLCLPSGPQFPLRR